MNSRSLNESLEKIYEQYDTTPETGLTSKKAEERCSFYDSLTESTSLKEKIGHFLALLSKPFSLVLIFTSLLLYITQSPILGSIIIILLFFANFFVYRNYLGVNRKIIEENRKYRRNNHITALRDGQKNRVRKSDLVPGDIIFIHTGQRVDFPVKIIDAKSLKVEDSGEIKKISEGKLVPPNSPIVSGKAKGVLLPATNEYSNRTKASNFSLIDIKSKLNLPDSVIFLLGAGLLISLFILPLQEYKILLNTFAILGLASVPFCLPLIKSWEDRKFLRKISKEGIVPKGLDNLDSFLNLDCALCDMKSFIDKNSYQASRVFVNRDLVFHAQDEFRNYEGELNARTQDALGLVLKSSMLFNVDKDDQDEDKLHPIEKGLKGLSSKGDMEALKEELSDFSFVDQYRNPSQDVWTKIVKGGEENLISVTVGDPSKIVDSSKFIYQDKNVYPLEADYVDDLRTVSRKLKSRGKEVLAVSYKILDSAWDPAKLNKGLVFLGIIGFSFDFKDNCKEIVENLDRKGIKFLPYTEEAPEMFKAFFVDELEKSSINNKEVSELDPEDLSPVDLVYGVDEHPLPEMIDKLKTSDRSLLLFGKELDEVSAMREVSCSVASRQSIDLAQEVSDMNFRSDKSELKKVSDFLDYKEEDTYRQRVSENVFNSLIFSELFLIISLIIFQLDSLFGLSHLLWLNFFNGLILGGGILTSTIKKSGFPRIFSMDFSKDRPFLLNGVLISATILILGVLFSLFTSVKINSGEYISILFTYLVFSSSLFCMNYFNPKKVFFILPMILVVIFTSIGYLNLIPGLTPLSLPGWVMIFLSLIITNLTLRLIRA